MHLFIKNMVCNRCILVVQQELEKLKIPYSRIELGDVELEQAPAPEQLSVLGQQLHELGFELLDDKKTTLIEKIKTTIIRLIHGSDNDVLNTKLSVVLQEALNVDYHYLSTLFSSTEGLTIEKYVILQRIERVKELLQYDEMNLSEIAFNMGYSSVQHLSQQFKKITGMTPSGYRQLKHNDRKPLDKV
ncbi:helix-turn-helix domain-containing protein [Chitinophaga rhizophila]|uniref:Helix-turn-helix transcriptional regulator n=1 Tax=Chitinophaga rhizophila TaxID=2866212 RepID=A0ABS7GLC6_9BACT|nr:helix-turn-helix transcriptional regulator [Chitinophaga rhizophila]MBW8687452.1 helix-turn-helix transcriptional regulator [Chitinophaga rhizophila]